MDLGHFAVFQDLLRISSLFSVMSNNVSDYSCLPLKPYRPDKG